MVGDGALAGSIGVSGVSLGFQPRADELLAAGKAQETFTRAGTGRAGVLRLRRNQNRVWPGCSRELGARPGDPGGGRFWVAGREDEEIGRRKSIGSSPPRGLRNAERGARRRRPCRRSPAPRGPGRAGRVALGGPGSGPHSTLPPSASGAVGRPGQ